MLQLVMLPWLPVYIEAFDWTVLKKCFLATIHIIKGLVHIFQVFLKTWFRYCMNIATVFSCCNYSSCLFRMLTDPFPDQFQCKWWPACVKSIFHRLSEVNMGLKHTEKVKSSGQLPKFQSFYCKILSLCYCPSTSAQHRNTKETKRGKFILKRK